MLIDKLPHGHASYAKLSSRKASSTLLVSAAHSSTMSKVVNHLTSWSAMSVPASPKLSEKTPTKNKKNCKVTSSVHRISNDWSSRHLPTTSNSPSTATSATKSFTGIAHDSTAKHAVSMSARTAEDSSKNSTSILPPANKYFSHN